MEIAYKTIYDKMRHIKKFNEGMDMDYIAAKQAIDELDEILSEMEHGDRSEIADEIIEFVNRIKEKYSN
jgi:hypothetical protein